MPIWFDEPRWLVLLALLVPVWIMARRGVGVVSNAKLVLSVGARTLLVVLLAMALARPVWVKRGEGLTVTVLLERQVKHPLYGKYIKRSTKVQAHDAENSCGEGDKVMIAECRPFSKTKSWQVLEILERAQ